MAWSTRGSATGATGITYPGLSSRREARKAARSCTEGGEEADDVQRKSGLGKHRESSGQALDRAGAKHAVVH